MLVPFSVQFADMSKWQRHSFVEHMHWIMANQPCQSIKPLCVDFLIKNHISDSVCTRKHSDFEFFQDLQHASDEQKEAFFSYMFHNIVSYVVKIWTNDSGWKDTHRNTDRNTDKMQIWVEGSLFCLSSHWFAPVAQSKPKKT